MRVGSTRALDLNWAGGVLESQSVSSFKNRSRRSHLFFAVLLVISIRNCHDSWSGPGTKDPIWWEHRL